MADSSDQSRPRRDFIASGGRYVALGGFAAYLATQAAKRQRLVGDPNCLRLSTCSDCVELSSGCRLPKAEDFRAAQADGSVADKKS
jgi:hypothetical protein